MDQLREAMHKSELNDDEEPLWKGKENELKAKFGLR